MKVTTRPIGGLEAVPLLSRLVDVCGKPLVTKLGELIRTVGPDVRALGLAAVRQALAGPTTLIDLLGAASDALAKPDAADLVRDLCRYAFADGRPLEDDRDYDAVFSDQPWAAVEVALEVAVARGFFSPARTLFDAARVMLAKAATASGAPSSATS